MRLALLSAVLAVTPLAAQQQPAQQQPAQQAPARPEPHRQETPPEPPFRIGVGLCAADVEVDSEVFGDDDALGGLVRLRFEVISRDDFGGGVRFEAWASDDLVTFSNTVRVISTTLFSHFTYRLDGERFEAPLRAGLRASRLALDGPTPLGEDKAWSLGPYVEIAPELTLIHGSRARWTIYGELGAGYTFTYVDDGSTPREFETGSLFYGAEVGTRLRFDVLEWGIAWLGRFQSTDRDVEGGTGYPSVDTTFRGVLFTLTFRF